MKIKFTSYQYQKNIETAYFIIISSVLFRLEMIKLASKLNIKTFEKVFDFFSTLNYLEDGDLELFRSPLFLTIDGGGDCDDKALFFLTWLYAFNYNKNSPNIDGMFLLKDDPKGDYTHIYNAVYSSKLRNWIEVDLTYKDQLGFFNHSQFKTLVKPTRALYTWLYSYIDPNISTTDEFLIFKNARKLFNEMKKNNGFANFCKVIDYDQPFYYNNIIPPGEYSPIDEKNLIWFKSVL